MKTNHESGFSLAELAIVMVIVGLMLAGLMPSLTAQIDQKRYNETVALLNEAKEALLGYAMTHMAGDGKPYLPCPDIDQDGLENRNDHACSAVEGNLPWSTLGVAAVDSWGNRFRYRVHSQYSDSGSGFSLDTATPNLRVCSVMGCVSGSTLATQLPVVVLSHGKNGAGANNAAGTQNPVPSGEDEKGNVDNNNDFISHPQTIAPNEFDDLVTWVPSSILYSRMLSAGRLP